MEPRIVLSMIVKNESAVIERCLASVLPHVDAWVIVDTGSSDDTRARIANAARAKPGFLPPSEAWLDFGTNRTRAAQAARDWVKRQGWKLADTYLLLIDADMVLRVGADFRRASLSAPHVQLMQDDGAMRYFNTRLVRLSHDWRAVGVTHEYWAATPAIDPVRLDSIWIDDRADGGAKSDKLERDIRLLSRGLELEPGNARYLFYLANSYADSGLHGEAIRWYEHRLAAGGWEEELWYTRYRQGLSYLRTGQTEIAAGILLDAYQRRPERAEPLVALARHYRERALNHVAFMLALQASRIPYPEQDTLFVSTAAHGSEPLVELAITAYYVGERALGLEMCERLLARRDAASVRGAAHTAKNELFYLPEAARTLARGSIRISPMLRARAGRFWSLGLEQPNQVSYQPKNPTLARYRGRVFINVCLVNYEHARGRSFVSKDPDGVIRTRSVILEWNAERALPTSEHESQIALPEGWPPAPRVRGLEDQRWVLHGDRVWLTATTCHVPGASAEPRVVLGRMSEDMQGINRLLALTYDGITACEKNWLPWSVDGNLYLIYGHDPLVVLQVDTDSGQCREVTRWSPPWSALRWRGAAPPVARPGESERWVGLVHETVWLDDSTVYLHRWVEYSSVVAAGGERQFRLERFSRLFSFEHQGVEYTCGLLDQGDGTLLVTYGSEESEACWALFAWQVVDQLLTEGPVDPETVAVDALTFFRRSGSIAPRDGGGE